MYALFFFLAIAMMVIVLRLLGAWMLRINELINNQVTLKEGLARQLETNNQLLREIRNLLDRPGE